MKEIFNGKYYSMYRPVYPETLIEYITELCVTKDKAWDCCTGTGIVANMLSARFNKIIATDISSSQIAHAILKNNIEYKVENIYDANIPKNSVDLIAVAQAFHWLDQLKFYNKVREVMKPCGTLAIWCHSPYPDEIADVTKKYLSLVIESLPKDEMTVYMKNLAYIESGYAKIDMPFEIRNYKLFEMIQQWDMYRYVGYLESISASNIYKEKYGHSAVVNIIDDLRKIWGNESKKMTLNWKIHLHTFRG